MISRQTVRQTLLLLSFQQLLDWILWQIKYVFQQCKNFENRLRFDKVTESLKVGTFLRHSVVSEMLN